MEWLDIAGPPGVGKSTVCDPIWGPHDIPIEDVSPPAEWQPFLNEITRLMGLVRQHPSFVAAVRMNRRSVRKMAVVNSRKNSETYIQTGFVQRGLGFGWRLLDLGLPVEELFWFYNLMPVSKGVVFLTAPPDVIKERNMAREKVKETAHENRAFMVDNMVRSIEYAVDVLQQRKVRVEICDTTKGIDETRLAVLDVANGKTRNPAPIRSRSKMPVLSKPIWW